MNSSSTSSRVRVLEEAFTPHALGVSAVQGGRAYMEDEHCICLNMELNLRPLPVAAGLGAGQEDALGRGSPTRENSSPIPFEAAAATGGEDGMYGGHTPKHAHTTIHMDTKQHTNTLQNCIRAHARTHTSTHVEAILRKCIHACAGAFAQRLHVGNKSRWKKRRMVPT